MVIGNDIAFRENCIIGNSIGAASTKDLTTPLNDNMVADLKFAPLYETVADTTITPKFDESSIISMSLAGSGTNRVTRVTDLAAGDNDRFYKNSNDDFCKERTEFDITTAQSVDDNPAHRYKCSFNGTDDRVVITGSGGWLPTGSSWSYAMWDSVTTLGVGTLWAKGPNTHIKMDALGDITLTYGGVNCGVIATKEAGIFSNVTLVYDHVAQTMTVWHNAQTVINAVDVSTAVMDSSEITKFCIESTPSAYTEHLDGFCHHDRYWNVALEDDFKYAIFYNPWFAFPIAILGDSLTIDLDSYYPGSPVNHLQMHYTNYEYGDGDDILFIRMGHGNRTFYWGVPDDYVLPGYITGDRSADFPPPKATGVPVVTTNITHAVERCKCPIVFWDFTQNWTQDVRDYTEGPNVYSEYMDGLAAAQTLCDNNNVKLIKQTCFPWVDLANIATPGVSRTFTKIKPTSDQIKVVYPSTEYYDMWGLNFDTPYGWGYYAGINDTNGASVSSSYQENLANGNVNGWEAWQLHRDPAHPNARMHYIISREKIKLIDSFLPEEYIPTYSNPIDSFDVVIDARNGDSINWRDQLSNSIESINNIGSDVALTGFVNSRFDVPVKYRDYGNGIKTFGGDANGEYGELPDQGNKYWNSDEYTLTVLFVADISSTASVPLQKDGRQSNTAFLLSADTAVDISFNGSNSVDLNDVYNTETLRGEEVVRLTYVAYMNGATPEYYIRDSRKNDAIVATGVRATESLVNTCSLGVFAGIGYNGSQALQYIYSTYGSSRTKIIQIGVNDTAISPQEMARLEYFDKKDLPIFAGNTYDSYDVADFTANNVATPDAVLMHEWPLTAITAGETPDIVGSLNADAVGNEENQGGEDCIAMRTTSDFIHVPGTERHYGDRWQSWSMECKVRINSVTQNPGGFFGTLGIVGQSRSTGLHHWIGTMRYTRNGNLSTVLNPMNDDQWYHVHIAYDPQLDSHSIWIDKVLINNNLNNGNNYNLCGLICGANSSDNSQFIQDGTTIGSMYRDFRYYHGKLTQAQVDASL